MKKILIILILVSSVLLGQSFKIEEVKGTVKAQIGTGEKWIDVKEGEELQANSVISTDKNSSAVIKGKNSKIILKESSAISLDELKAMTLDELLLALAMEDMLSTPKKKGNSKSGNTAVYGEELKKGNGLLILSDNFGIKRLNGAVQLAENGFEESAVVTAKEIYRKYPETKSLINYRMFFADILFSSGLYEEAYEEYSSLKDLKKTEEEEKLLGSRLEKLSQKLRQPQ